MILSASIDFFVAKQIYNSVQLKTKRIILAISVIANLSILGFFKYFNFFIESTATFLLALGFQPNTYTLNILLPVGISFYTFQSISYSIDVYRGHIHPTKHYLTFIAYVSFFPQLVAGPIERAKNLLPQFSRKRIFSKHEFMAGFYQALWGLFKKVVIADNCAPHVDAIFANHGSLDSGTLILGTLLFSFQIYADFSGYSDIAIGIARMLGFNLITNFKYPYFSRDIAEFWRRWHISLSTWFRDYVYIPLGGSKVSKTLAVRNTLVIFTLSGLWHGANFTFIIWGILNACFFIPLLLRGSNRRYTTTVVAEDSILPSIKELVAVVKTFALCMVAWVFFRAESISDAIQYISRIVTTIPTFEYHAAFPILILISLFVSVEWISRRKLHPLQFVDYLSYRSIALAILVFWATFIWGNFGITEFIYFQF